MRGNMVCGGGEGTDIENLTAIAEQVLNGQTFIGRDSEEPQAGEMPNIGALDTARGLRLVNGIIQIGMALGAHITNASMGYPEVGVSQADIAALIELTAQKIAKGIIIAGITGTYGSDGNLTEETLLTGKIGYGANGRVVGGMPNNGSVSKTLAAGEKQDIANGYYSGGNVSADTLANQTPGTAGAGHILNGKTGWVNGVKITGSMTNRGKVTQQLNAGGSYTIPAGYHDGTGKVSANSLASQTPGTAGAVHILSGKTGWVNGVKITGSMTNRGKVTQQLNAGGSYTIPAGYHDGTGKVSGNSLASQTVADATAAMILIGLIAWVNGIKITGTMPNRGKVTQQLNAGGSYTIPAGYHNGEGVVSANSLASQTQADAAAGHILNGKTAWVNGVKITGTIESKAAETITPGTSDIVIAAGQHLAGAQIIEGDGDLIAANIANGKTIFGVTGTWKGNFKILTAVLEGSVSWWPAEQTSKESFVMPEAGTVYFDMAYSAETATDNSACRCEITLNGTVKKAIELNYPASQVCDVDYATDQSFDAPAGSTVEVKCYMRSIDNEMRMAFVQAFILY